MNRLYLVEYEVRVVDPRLRLSVLERRTFTTKAPNAVAAWARCRAHGHEPLTLVVGASGEKFTRESLTALAGELKSFGINYG